MAEVCDKRCRLKLKIRKAGAFTSQRIYIITLLSFHGPNMQKTRIALPYIDKWYAMKMRKVESQLHYSTPKYTC